jgi:curved DNA-binding protein CbpA
MEQKDPYEILGLRKDATRDEIVKRYNLLLKKYRSD